MKTPTPTFDSFKDFYLDFVVPLKKNNPEFVRLDGKITGATRTPAAYFMYKGSKWKIDADTYLDKIQIAFDLLKIGEEPFFVKQTQSGKGECLIIQGQPLKNKKFYIYKITTT